MSVSAVAPSTAPTIEPLPPTTSIERNTIDLSKLKSSGDTNCICVANRHPATAAYSPLSANAVSLTRGTDIPVIAVEISSSQTAIIARPDATP